MKYKLTKTTKKYGSLTLYQIEAVKDFGNVEKGEKGGYVERENNLSQDGNAWVSGNARVYGNAEVSDNAWVYGDAEVSGNVKCETGCYFAYKKKDWDVTEVPVGENGVLLARNYKPPTEKEEEELISIKISKSSLEELKKKGIKILEN